MLNETTYIRHYIAPVVQTNDLQYADKLTDEQIISIIKNSMSKSSLIRDIKIKRNNNHIKVTISYEDGHTIMLKMNDLHILHRNYPVQYDEEYRTIMKSMFGRDYVMECILCGYFDISDIPEDMWM